MVLQDTNSQTIFTIFKNNKKYKFSKIRFVCDFNIIVDYFHPITNVNKNIVMTSFVRKRRIFKYSISSNNHNTFIRNNKLRIPNPISNRIHIMFKKYCYSTSAYITNIYPIFK
jgi:hypothetical protein